jgi:hypothetical protein
MPHKSTLEPKVRKILFQGEITLKEHHSLFLEELPCLVFYVLNVPKRPLCLLLQLNSLLRVVEQDHLIATAIKLLSPQREWNPVTWVFQVDLVNALKKLQKQVEEM